MAFIFFLESLKAFPKIKTYLKYIHFFLKIYVSEMAFLGLPHDFFLKEISFFLELFILEREPPRSFSFWLELSVAGVKKEPDLNG